MIFVGIIVNAETRVVVQGITGGAGSAHAKTMMEYGTRIVAGVRPGGAGQEVLGVPVYNSVKEAVDAKKANTSIMFVPAKVAKGAAFEAIDAGIKVLVIIPEHVPPLDVIAILEKAEQRGVIVIGPNTPGIINPAAKTKVGFVPNQYYMPGNVGVASRSGTLTYEIVSRLTKKGIGQSTCIGIGGDPIVGTPFPKILKMFQEDPETKVILLICEIGGSQEEEAAELLKSGAVTKPVVAYVAGYAAPKGKRLGHAGALINGETGTIENKLKLFKEAGVDVAKLPDDVVGIITRKLR